MAVLVIVGLTAAYSAAALASWALVNAPFAGRSNLPGTLIWLFPVLIPYAFVLLAHKLSSDTLSRRATFVLSIVTALIALGLYTNSFTPNDGEYGIVFFLVPITQSIFALLAVGFALRKSTYWRFAYVVLGGAGVALLALASRMWR